MGDTVTNRSGGIDINAQRIDIGGDVAGRDIIKQTIEAPRPLALALHQLPAPPRDFTGRTADLDAILNDIKRGAVISGVRGMGGIGKTALALVIADQLKAQYPDAQFFIDLRGASDQPLKPLDAMRSVIRAYHPTAQLPDDAAQIAALYRSVLDGQRAIVLLDDAKDTAQITPLLPPASCLLLVTTRNRFAVPGLKVKDLNVLSPTDAYDLLIAIAPRLAPTPTLPRSQEARTGEGAITPLLTTAVSSSGEGPGVRVGVADEIARLCGYLPLALRAAASLITATPDLNPLAYAAQLRDEHTRLTKIGKEGVEIDVEASLNLSYRQLSPEAARVFRQLSVFPTSFDAAAAETVCEDADHAHLSQLVRLSLVLYEDTTNRYSLHDLVRLFAAARLTDDERPAAHLRHAAHYLSVLRQAQTLYLQGDDSLSRGLALFDREWPDIQAGQAWAATHAENDDEAAVICSDYPHSGIYILMFRQHPRDQIKWLEPALTAARRLKDRTDEGVHLGNLGLAHADLGETRKAIKFYEQALVVARDIGDKRSEDAWLGDLGIAYTNLGETRKAIEYHEQALVIAREIGDRRGEGATLGNLGIAHAILGETRKAIEFYEQRLVIARDIGDRLGEGSALGNLGIAYRDLGETRKAIEFLEQQLVIVRDIGNRRGEGNASFNMALALDKLGERAQVIAHAEAALKIYEAIEDPNTERVRRQLAEWKSSGQKKWWQFWK